LSKQALARLYTYSPPPTTYHSLPLTRRAAVLVLLFADRRGDLRVVLTLRSPLLRTFAGQVALPGGKADFCPRPQCKLREERRMKRSDCRWTLIISHHRSALNISRSCHVL
jgi:hypothetical protein